MVFKNELERIGYQKQGTVNQIANINMEKKEKPHNIQINNNAKQPKVTPNLKYTDEQRFRRYKTRVEPKLLNRIKVNEDDDIIDKIRAAFDPEYKKPNTNYSGDIPTAPAPFNKGADQPPEMETNIYNEEVKDNWGDVFDTSRKDEEALTFQDDSDYNFMTESTPVRGTQPDDPSNAAFFKFWDAGGTKDGDNTLALQLKTPTEEAQHRKWSAELTGPRRRTPAEILKEGQELDKEIADLFTDVTKRTFRRESNLQARSVGSTQTADASTERRPRGRPRKDSLTPIRSRSVPRKILMSELNSVGQV
jgi:hypothetical protein